METLAPARTASSTQLRLGTTRDTQFVDLTDAIASFVSASRVRTGTVTVQTRHTTTAIIVNEHEPLLLADFLWLLDRIAPRSERYAHDDLSRRRDVADDEPKNGHAHCRALLLPPSVTLNVAAGRLALGHWQRVFLVELDGPRTRDVSLVILGEPEL